MQEIEKVKRDLQQLSKFDRWKVVTYWRLLLVRRKYLNQSLPLRLVPFHAVGMLILLLSFPHTYSLFIIAPVLFAVAYYVTLLLLFLSPSAYKSQIKKVQRLHWIR